VEIVTGCVGDTAATAAACAVARQYFAVR